MVHGSVFRTREVSFYCLRNICACSQSRNIGFIWKSEESTGWTTAHFMVATAYGKGLVAAEQYPG